MGWERPRWRAGRGATRAVGPAALGWAVNHAPRPPPFSLFPASPPRLLVPSLLAVEHVEEDNKPMLYLVRLDAGKGRGWTQRGGTEGAPRAAC